MGNIMISIKRFLGNKNTVTILGVIIGIAVLYFGYNIRVNRLLSHNKYLMRRWKLLVIL